MQRFFDELISYVRAIEVTGVDVGDTEANNLAQDRECTVVVCWRPEYIGTSQLHGTVSHASKDQIIGELECASWQCCRRGRPAHGFVFKCVTVSPSAGAATARSSAILAYSCNPPEYEAAAVSPFKKLGMTRLLPRARSGGNPIA